MIPHIHVVSHEVSELFQDASLVLLAFTSCCSAFKGQGLGVPVSQVLPARYRAIGEQLGHPGRLLFCIWPCPPISPGDSELPSS